MPRCPTSLPLLAAAILLAGCGEDVPRTPAGLAAAISAARDDAKASREARDPKAARKAAERAADLVGRLRETAESAEPVSADAKGLLAAADADARAARKWADLADEELRMAKLRGGLKAKAYRAGRAALLAGVFKGLSLAADQAATKGLDGLPQQVQDAARAAAALAADLADRKPLPDGSPDWKGISADMSAFATSPPEPLALYLAAAWALSGKGGPAVWELDMVDAAAASSNEEERQIRQFLPVLVYRVNGCPRMAILALQESLDRGELTSEERAELHVVSALLYAWDKDWTNADLELGRALIASPNHPIAVYLTGERLAADGQWEKSAESLEAAGRVLGEDQWLTERVAERARRVRDGSDGDKPLYLDRVFLIRLAAEGVGRTAARSEAAARCKRWLEASGLLGDMLGASDEADSESDGEPRVGDEDAEAG